MPVGFVDYLYTIYVFFLKFDLFSDTGNLKTSNSVLHLSSSVDHRRLLSDVVSV